MPTVGGQRRLKSTRIINCEPEDMQKAMTEVGHTYGHSGKNHTSLQRDGSSHTGVAPVLRTKIAPTPKGACVCGCQEVDSSCKYSEHWAKRALRRASGWDVLLLAVAIEAG